MPTDPDIRLAEGGLPAPGAVLAGKYRVERIIGVGGMGVVVAATHVGLDERVALKLLKRDVTTPESTARFLREARAAAKIKSEHVVDVTDVGTLDSGAPYMVMELLEGEDLAALVEEGPLPIGDAVAYVLEACEAVAEAHALGIVHRDLKPANLFRARRPGGQRVIKVVDFGISKVVSKSGQPNADAGMTSSSSWLGSPLYMSPEQMRSARDVDARTDIWSLGLILFQLLTARVPFDGVSIPDLCIKVMHEEPERLDRLRPEVPAGLVAVVSKCLQKKPDDRYLNVAELALDLAPFASDRAKASVERIVSVITDAGLMRPSRIPKAPAISITNEARDSDPPETEPPSTRAPLPPSPPAAPRAPTPAPPAQIDDDGARTSEIPAPSIERPPRRRRGGVAVLLACVIAAGSASAAYVFWPRPKPVVPIAPSPTTTTSATTATTRSAAPIVLPAPPASAPAVPSAIADAGTTAAGTLDAGILDAGAHDAGIRRPRRMPVDPGPTISPPPVPQQPAPSTQTCFQTLPDGTVKQVPCPN